MSIKDIIVIGDGLAARTILASLDKKYAVLQIADNKRFPPASLSAGALASCYGARRGVSELGDINVASIAKFSRFVSDMSLNYVAQEMNYFLPEKSHTEIEKHRFNVRWGEDNIRLENGYYTAKDMAFLIEPKEYLERLKSLYDGSVEGLKATVSSLEEGFVHLETNDKLQAKFIIDCRGAYDEDKPHKISFGAYYTIPYECGEQDILLNIKGTNVLYHSRFKKLIVGATTQNDGSMIVDLGMLKSKQAPTDQLLSSLNMPAVDWSRAEIMSGLRSKGKMRIPQWGWNKSVFSIYGLYKNGLMYSVSALEELAQKISLDSKIQL